MLLIALLMRTSFLLWLMTLLKPSMTVLVRMLLLTATILPMPHALLNGNLKHFTSLIANTYPPPTLTKPLNQVPYSLFHALKPLLPLVSLKLESLKLTTTSIHYLTNHATNSLPTVPYRLRCDPAVWIRRHAPRITTQTANTANNIIQIPLPYEVPASRRVDREVDVFQDTEEAFFWLQESGFGADGDLKRKGS
jgi:hypothetical protein